MDMHAVFDAWAPQCVLWSKWAKPVLFSYMKYSPQEPGMEPVAPAFDLSAGPVADGATCVVVDIPGARSVALGLALAARSFRPVPLFNAMPWALGPDASPCDAPKALPIVEVWPMVHALRRGAETLSGMTLPWDACPAFLLDGVRRHGVHTPEPGRFDNRSVSFPTDFPSAAFLHEHGIRKVVLMLEGEVAPQSDLAHTLCEWQREGLAFFRINVLRLPQVPAFIQLEPPTMLRRLWCTFLMKCGWMREPLGGFGGILSEPAAG